MQQKRLFFGISTDAPWPSELPDGRILKEENRHLTLAFLGNVDFDLLQPHLAHCPKLPLRTGFVGYFDKVLFLPERYPNVVSWHLKWLGNPQALLDYQKKIVEWLKVIRMPPVGLHREFLPHVTICRKPFDIKSWKKSFYPFPFQTTSLHLFESVGQLNYVPCWSSPMTPPFKELEHTADVAFEIFGENIEQIFLHAQIALAWKHVPLIGYLPSTANVQTLEDVVSELNKLISIADRDSGCPLKAVSYHGEIQTFSTELLHWEMIIDV